MLVTLIAFFLQTYLTQTHIHLVAEGRASLVLELASGKAAGSSPIAPKDTYPANEDPANCPLCQELIHAGQFVMPAAAAVLLPFISICVIEIASPTAHLRQAVTHIWRGRAPPLG